MATRRAGKSVVAAVGVLAVLAACGSGRDASAPPSSPGSDVSTTSASAPPDLGFGPDGPTRLSCSGSPGFDPALVAEGGLPLPPGEREAVMEALSSIAAEAGVDAPEVLQGHEMADVRFAALWREQVAGRAQLGVILTAAPEFDLPQDQLVTVESTGTRSWQVVGWGGPCWAAPALPVGLSWAQVALPGGSTGADGDTSSSTASARPTSSGTTIAVLVSEIECTSARDPEPHLQTPLVVQTEEAVTVYWTTRSAEGDQTCPGNPWVPREIVLDEPLGDRPLLDGSRWPAQPLGAADALPEDSAGG